MVKCLECGFEADRLQWTHFKYKCNGKFKNGTEYMAAHPGAAVVSAELAKKSALSLDGFINRYGPSEGKKRWDSYREKQAYSNSYEYKKEKYGWSEKEFNEYNKSRKQTIETMISRHGEELGTIKWQEYCERQAYTNTKEYFIKKYGVDRGTAEIERINLAKASSSCPVALSKKLGISLDDAVNIITSRHKLAYTSQIELDFIKEIESIIGKLEYTNLSKPYGKWSHDKNGYYVFDIKHKDAIIEFNGDYWHANPKSYLADDIIRNKFASDIWKNDAHKLDFARSFGFRVMVVWESDYKINKQKTINEVVTWIQNGQK